MQAELVTLSRQGGRAHNEDALGHCSTGPYLACVVADGAGGHGGGDVASAIARQTVLQGFEAAPTLDAAVLRALAESANRNIVQRQAPGGQLARMRSTLVLAVFDLEQDLMVWAHSGDSRAYLFRDRMIAARTSDHSLVQQMVRGGMLDEEQARRHPQRSVLLSALGSDDGSVVVDVSDPLRLQPGDLVLLCSDGVWEPLGDARLSELVQDSGSPTQLSQRIGTEIAALADPEQDNYTVLLVRVDEEDEQTRFLE